MASAVWNTEATILLGSPSIPIPPIQFHLRLPPTVPPSLSPLSFFAERATSSPLSNPSIKVPSLSLCLLGLIDFHALFNFREFCLIFLMIFFFTVSNFFAFSNVFSPIKLCIILFCNI